MQLKTKTEYKQMFVANWLRFSPQVRDQEQVFNMTYVLLYDVKQMACCEGNAKKLFVCIKMTHPFLSMKQERTSPRHESMMLKHNSIEWKQRGYSVLQAICQTLIYQILRDLPGWRQHLL